ncbi:hypothetical protein GCM10027167_51140 [Nocardia heshunensis]
MPQVQDVATGQIPELLCRIGIDPTSEAEATAVRIVYRDGSAAKASRAKRLLPTPGGPVSRMPAESDLASTAWPILSSSAARPVIGHTFTIR